MKTLAERVNYLLSLAGNSLTELARIAGVKPPSVSDWLNGKTKSIQIDPATRLGKKFGLNPLWISKGTGLMRDADRPAGTLLTPDATPSTGVSAAALAAVMGGNQGGTLLTGLHDQPGTPSDDLYALIPQYTAKGACGAAHHNGHVEVRGGLAFKRDWLARMGLRPEDLSVIAACGDSMSPTIQSDEVLLVDHSQALPVDGKVFAMERDDELVVKRLVRDFSGSWIVRSDNPDKARYGDFPVSDSDLRIVGRVVWRGGGL